MVEIARKAVARDGLTDRVEVRRWHIGRKANPLAPRLFDAVVSNSLLHHMSDPLDLWKAVRSCAAPGAGVLVMDLFRPASRQEARSIVRDGHQRRPRMFPELPARLVSSGRGR